MNNYQTAIANGKEAIKERVAELYVNEVYQLYWCGMCSSERDVNWHHEMRASLTHIKIWHDSKKQIVQSHQDASGRLKRLVQTDWQDWSWAGAVVVGTYDEAKFLRDRLERLARIDGYRLI